jgi:hypothetical protein
VGVGAAESTVVVVDVAVAGVPEGAGTSRVLVVSVVVVVSFFWQPNDSPTIPTASREPSVNSFFMMPLVTPCAGAPRSS